MPKVKDMTREERHRYKQMLSDRCAARGEAEQQQRAERDALIRTRVNEWRDEACRILDDANSEHHARLIVLGLGDDARKVLGLFVAIGEVDFEGASALSGLSKRKLTAIYNALWDCLAIYPDIERFEMDVEYDVVFDAAKYAVNPARALMLHVSKSGGDVVNPTVASLLKTADVKS